MHLSSSNHEKYFSQTPQVSSIYGHIIFSIPKLIRRCFLFDRKLLAALSRIAWETLKEYMGTDCLLPGHRLLQEMWANWARLIQKIYETDPLTCPKCSGIMRILAFIEEEVVIRRILEHLGLWDVPKRKPKQGRGPPVTRDAEPQLVYADSQVTEYEEAYYKPEYLS